MNRMMCAFLLLSSLTQLSGGQTAVRTPPSCVPSTLSTATTSEPTMVRKERALPKEIHWVRNSAEYRACLLQAYRLATLGIEWQANDLTSGTWAVVLDADETVIDNSGFQKQLASEGAGYSPAAWKAWCLRGEATVLPGALAFMKRVGELGGKLVIITNRTTDVQTVTEENFRREGIPYDLMLCKSGSSEKEARNESVEKGTAAPGFPPLKIVMWVGDNIQDFPKHRQSIRAGEDIGYSGFGSRYIMLPNPMYGSWERNPER